MNQKALAPIPMLDLRQEVKEHWDEYSKALLDVLASGQFINGPETKAFEKEAADYLGVRHAIGVNSGTDALVISLRALGIGPGDEVITPSFSFFATAESISNVGAKPVFVDVEEQSFNIDSKEVKKAISKKTKAILPVHLFGRPANMTEIINIAKEHDLKVIEDAAQSFGARYLNVNSSIHNKFTGAIGDINAFSFYPTKNLGAFGDGGLITTNADGLAELAMKLRNHGSSKRYHNDLLGYNSRLDSMQSAILRVKLRNIDRWNNERRNAAKYYNELLSEIDEITVPEIAENYIFHQYTIRLSERDAAINKLATAGISSMIYYPIPQDKLAVYEGKYRDFKITNKLANEVLSLPIWPGIKKEQQQRIVREIKTLF